MRALHRITGEGGDLALATFLEALQSEEGATRLAAARLAGRLGATNDAIGNALRAIESNDANAAARRAAAASLAELAE